MINVDNKKGAFGEIKIVKVKMKIVKLIAGAW